ncbi:hypothetical protein BDZ89DRAFT_1109777 [Hymenopellis radicata]|nr:hypothetical protein BDZ89DRAFT_1109777 [Hymenopellis radicata]
MELYRDILVQIVERALAVEKTVVFYAKDLLVYLDEPAPWAPRSKSDRMAIHSISMNVRSADEMRPLVSDLLEWLQDPNWPVAAGCREQLKRFPVVVINPIRDVLRTSDDDYWKMQLLIFLEQDVEGGIREHAREEVEEMVRNPTEESIDSGTLEAAQDCLTAMNEWRDAVTVVEM